MKTLILAAIRCSLMFTAVSASLFSVRPAQAYTVTLQQAGANVVANGSGAINLMGLTFVSPFNTLRGIKADIAFIRTGSLSNIADGYTGFTGPTSFGSGGFSSASTGGRDNVGIQGSGFLLLVPIGYVSGSPLSSRAAWNNATFDSLGVTPGTYVWSWGTGLPNQNFTLIIEEPTVPDSGWTVSLLGCALVGLAALRRNLCC